MMGPAALLDYDRKKLRGLVLEEGGPTSHVAIVARALGIPAVGEVENASGLVEAGDPIIVDGVTGEVYLRPSPDIEAAYVERVRLRARKQAQYQTLRGKPCVTKDGHEIALHLNAGPSGRPAAYRGNRRCRHRAVPHRIAVHGRDLVPAHRRAARALSRGAGDRQRQAGHLPHPRYRRRQGAAVYERFRGREPGAWAGAPSGSASTGRD